MQDKKNNIKQISVAGEIEYETALQYSKSELQQADSKINTMLVINSILLAIFTTVICSFVKDADWRWFWIFPMFTGLNLISLFILCWALFPRVGKDNKSPFYFKSMIKEVDIKMFEDNYYEKMVLKTLNINSIITNKKYTAIRHGMICTILPFMPIAVLIWWITEWRNVKKQD